MRWSFRSERNTRYKANVVETMGTSARSSRVAAPGFLVQPSFSVMPASSSGLVPASSLPSRLPRPRAEGATLTGRGVQRKTVKDRLGSGQFPMPPENELTGSTTSAVPTRRLLASLKRQDPFLCLLASRRWTASPAFVSTGQQCPSRVYLPENVCFRDRKESGVLQHLVTQSLRRCSSTSCLVFRKPPACFGASVVLRGDATSLPQRQDGGHAHLCLPDSLGHRAGRTQHVNGWVERAEVLERFLSVAFSSLGLSCVLLFGGTLLSLREPPSVRGSAALKNEEKALRGSRSLSPECEGQAGVPGERESGAFSFQGRHSSTDFLEREDVFPNGHLSTPLLFSARGGTLGRQLPALCRAPPKNGELPEDDCEESTEKVEQLKRAPSSPLAPFALSKEKYMQKKFFKASAYRRTASGK